QNIDPLSDTTAPRYAVESDEEEDEFNPLFPEGNHQSRNVGIDIKGISPTNAIGGNLVVATGDAGKIWAKGASLEEQQGAVYVNQLQVGLVFRPSWSNATTVVVSELTASLPIWAMSPYAQAVLDYFKPANTVLLDTYPTPVYITAAPVPYRDEAPVRYLSTGPSGTGAPSFAPPNLIQTTSAAFLSIVSVSSPSPSATAFLLPSPRIPRPRPSDLTQQDVSTISEEDIAWPSATMQTVDQAVFEVLGETLKRQWRRKDGAREGKSQLKRREVGDGSMYI
ncbi:hypothetical protein HETIRDRAFT_331260, partial [Heterobasidion irregulare TC 32-1]